MRLHFQSVGRGEPLVLLHGLLGSSDNWLGIAPQLSQHFRLLIPDLRNHGRSPHAAEMSFATMARDVVELMTAENVVAADIVGHSLGGKVAMQLAAAHPDRVRRVVVEDLAPRGYAPVYRPMLETMLRVKLEQCQSRNEVEQQLAPVVTSQGMRQFLLKNVGRDEAGKLFWRCHLAGIRDAYDELRGPVELPVLECPALFITGAKSGHVVPADEALIRSRFPHVEFRVIAGAGHWVHGEAPAEFVRVLEDWLKPAV